MALTIRQDMDGSLLPDLKSATRALVFLTVEWSGPERSARVVFRGAAGTLGDRHSVLGIERFVLDVDAAWCQTWLASLGIQELGAGHAIGAGSIVWLERGKLVSCEISGAALRGGEIVKRCLSLWGRSG